MKYFAIITFIIISHVSFSQEQVVFEPNKKTAPLFDESNPLSLISLLQQNALSLNYFNLKGMDASVYADLSEDERKSTFKFEGPMSDLPMVDEFGDPIIRDMPDGGQMFVYPPADTLFIDLYGIDKMVFTLHDGNEKPMDRLNELHLWKQYESGMQRVLTINAGTFMKFDGLHFYSKLSEAQTKKLTETSETKTLWSTMRDSCLHQMKWFEDQLTDGAYEEYYETASTNVQTYFPTLWSLQLGRGVQSRNDIEIEPSFQPYFYFERTRPFSMSLCDQVRNYLISTELLQQKFIKSHFIKTQSTVPLIDEYGEEVVTVDDEGMYQFVYESPKEEYFFLDYSPEIFVAKHIECDSDQNCYIVPNNLLFCLDEGNSLPELISALSLNFDDESSDRSYLKPFLLDFKRETVLNQPEFSLMETLINKKKYRKTPK